MDSAEDYLRVECEVSGDGRSVCLSVWTVSSTWDRAPRRGCPLACARPRCARLVVNLADVSFMDSSGLRVLVVARNALDERGAEMVIADINDQLRRLFEISGLTSAFTFEP